MRARIRARCADLHTERQQLVQHPYGRPDGTSSRPGQGVGWAAGDLRVASGLRFACVVLPGRRR
jgi:hypothetical protein